ncbi:MAG TPA: sigma-70 family RNA polymerase sigma factor [Blastocatellia bacterium]|jgi:RNA polymerase sigma-70 factor (ECF subfamily)|nr:sigma-70 family RNA polymerase sigma factor [Blastocatellia bacterium]
METIAISDICSRVDLVSRIRAGDRQAEAELVERYSRGVRIIIRREVHDTAVAEDIYQETFRIALEKIRQGDVREPERLSGFICGVARNLVIEYFRRAARQGGITEIEEASPLPHPAPDQLQVLLRKEKADFVRRILKEMPNERDIQVLYRFYIADDEKEQICADLGLTSLHFNRVLYRARERFRDLYERAMRDNK